MHREGEGRGVVAASQPSGPLRGYLSGREIGYHSWPLSLLVAVRSGTLQAGSPLMDFLSVYSDPNFHDCTVESIKTVTHDTKLFTVKLPQASFLSVPTGHHVAIRANINGTILLVHYFIIT